MTSLFRLSFCVIVTVLLVSSPVTVTIPFCRGLTEVAGHHRDSRASIVGLKLCFLARRFMIGSRDAAGARGMGEFWDAAWLGRFERSSAAVVTCPYAPPRRL